VQTFTPSDTCLRMEESWGNVFLCCFFGCGECFVNQEQLKRHFAQHNSRPYFVAPGKGMLFVEQRKTFFFPLFFQLFFL
jgi:hypothetical protein